MQRRFRRALVALFAVGGLLAGEPAHLSPASAQPIELDELGYQLGRSDAALVVVEFADFGCSACGLFARETLPSLKAEFVETGRVRWQHIPFLLGGFANARQALRAAECAAEQSGFWAMHDLLYARQREWQRARRPAEVLRRLAAEQGLDLARWQACYDHDGGRHRTVANNRAARQLHVRGTPTFFVGGVRIEGALSANQFREVITRALNEQ
jgi:protein-disulfide isomerase